MVRGGAHTLTHARSWAQTHGVRGAGERGGMATFCVVGAPDCFGWRCCERHGSLNINEVAASTAVRVVLQECDIPVECPGGFLVGLSQIEAQQIWIPH